MKRLSYNVKDACEAVGIKRTTFYKLRKEGVIWTFKLLGRTLIYEDVLRAALDGASGRAPAPESHHIPGPLDVQEVRPGLHYEAPVFKV